jgi:methylenetetrahydrofolate reductase (NADPH)
MKLKELYSHNKQTFSFEFFPPKTPDGEEKLFSTVDELKTLNPSFVSVTYGAMGTTQSNTLRIVSCIKKEMGLEAAAHLTCVGQTHDEIFKILTELKKNQIQNIVALRGDPPKGETAFVVTQGGFRYASELVAFIKKNFRDDFSLFVAGYPEGHIECSNQELGLEHLKLKINAGGDAIITQLFFDNDDYYRFVDNLRKKSINVPVIAGIMPITNGAQIQRFAQMCGAKIPLSLKTQIEKYGDDVESIEEYGVEYASQQCEQLLAQKIPGIHFYTLNRSKATMEIYKNLSLKGAL